MIKKVVCLLFLLTSSLSVFAQLQDIHGVIPSENVTSLEIKPRYKAKDDSKNKTVATVEIKPSFKINQHWKLGAEIPFTRYGEGEVSEKGLGDIMISGFIPTIPPPKFSPTA